MSRSIILTNTFERVLVLVSGFKNEYGQFAGVVIAKNKAIRNYNIKDISTVYDDGFDYFAVYQGCPIAVHESKLINKE